MDGKSEAEQLGYFVYCTHTFNIVTIFYGLAIGCRLIFKLLGTPNDKTWPGFSDLPIAKKLAFTEQPHSHLREVLELDLISLFFKKKCALFYVGSVIIMVVVAVIIIRFLLFCFCLLMIMCTAVSASHNKRRRPHARTAQLEPRQAINVSLFSLCVS